jgi:type IV pilus assembly protein PilM
MFKKKEDSYLGVDIGGKVVKLVELRNKSHKAELVTYAHAALPKVAASDSVFEDAESLAVLLKQAVKESGISTRKAVTALPSPAVFSAIINLPNIERKDISNKKKMQAAVMWEAKKVLPLPVEEMVIDWKVLPDNPNLAGVRVLLTSASNKLVRKYLELFAQADLELVSLETESFALTRSLVGNDTSTVMVVDMGAVNTYIMIVDQGIPFMDRTITTAGMSVTQLIADHLGVSIAQADQFKMDLANARKFDPQQITSLFESILQPIIHEIKYSFNLYKQDEYGGKDIDKIILTGGSSLLPHITDYLSQLLDVPVFLGDPWARVVYPEEMRPILDEIGPKFAISIGLGMRDIE